MSLGFVMIAITGLAATVPQGAGFAVVSGQASAMAAPSSDKDLVLVGTITEIRPQGESQSRKNWAVTVHVDKVTSGDFSGVTFTFSIHSPARAGLVVGRSYAIKATWTDKGYEVDEAQWRKS